MQDRRRSLIKCAFSGALFVSICQFSDALGSPEHVHRELPVPIKILCTFTEKNRAQAGKEMSPKKYHLEVHPEKEVQAAFIESSGAYMVGHPKLRELTETCRNMFVREYPQFKNRLNRVSNPTLKAARLKVLIEPSDWHDLKSNITAGPQCHHIPHVIKPVPQKRVFNHFLHKVHSFLGIESSQKKAKPKAMLMRSVSSQDMEDIRVMQKFFVELIKLTVPDDLWQRHPNLGKNFIEFIFKNENFFNLVRDKERFQKAFHSSQFNKYISPEMRAKVLSIISQLNKMYSTLQGRVSGWRLRRMSAEQLNQMEMLSKPIAEIRDMVNSLNLGNRLSAQLTDPEKGIGNNLTAEKKNKLYNAIKNYFNNLNIKSDNLHIQRKKRMIVDLLELDPQLIVQSSNKRFNSQLFSPQSGESPQELNSEEMISLLKNSGPAILKVFQLLGNRITSPEVKKALIEYKNTSMEERLNQISNALGGGNNGPLLMLKNYLNPADTTNLSEAFKNTMIEEVMKKTPQDMAREKIWQEVIAEDKLDKNGRTPLHYAAEKGELEVVKFLVDHGANKNKQTQSGDAPLNLAVYNGHPQIAKYLVEKGADINKPDVNGWAPLHSAAYKGDVKMVEGLMSHGAKKDEPTLFGSTPFHLAAFRGHSEVVKYFEKQGADINKPTNQGFTPLHSVAQKGDVKLVECLLELGANKDAETRNGDTPLNLAAYHGHTEVVESLLKHRANKNKRNKKGWAPLNTVVRRVNFDIDKYVKIAKLLVDDGADLDNPDNNQWTPMHTAVHKDNIDLFEYFVSHGAKMDLRDNQGKTPLMIAVEQGKFDFVKSLVDHGADVNRYDNKGLRPLFIAIKKGHLSIVKYLVEHGKNVDLEAVDSKLHTPLAQAAFAGHLKIVQYLINKGAYPLVIGMNHWSILKNLPPGPNREAILKLIETYIVEYKLRYKIK